MCAGVLSGQGGCVPGLLQPLQGRREEQHAGEMCGADRDPVRYAEGVPGHTLSRVGPSTQTPGSMCCVVCCVHAVGFVGEVCGLLLYCVHCVEFCVCCMCVLYMYVC